MRASIYLTSVLAAGATAVPWNYHWFFPHTYTITIGGAHPTTIIIPPPKPTGVVSSSPASASATPDVDAEQRNAARPTPAPTPKPSPVAKPSTPVAKPASSAKPTVKPASPSPSTQSPSAPSSPSPSSPTVGTSTPSSSTPSTSSSNADPPTTYINNVLRHHNVHRANHSASDLVWSASLAATAKKIAAKCVFAHDVQMDGGGYGQNLAAGLDASPTGIGESISELWYNNEMGYFDPYYGQPQPAGSNFGNVFESFGHFTQVVWKGTSSVGCYTYDCSSQGLANVGGNVPPYLTVCNYGPPGNYMNEFDTNVARPLGQPTVDRYY